jgi:hypothetical protein
MDRIQHAAHRALLVLAAIAWAAPAQAGHLTVYAIRSPNGVSWKSPRKLMLSTVLNKLSFKKDKRAIGHVAIEVDGEDGKILTGMAITNKAKQQYSKAALKDGRGLGVLLDTVEGRLEDAVQLAPELERHKAAGRVNYIRFELNKETEGRLRQYLAEYKARGIDKKYGGTNRPRLGEGSGCSAFGTSCMTVAGVMTKDMAKSWNRKVLLPKSLIGGDGKKVKMSKLFFGKQAGSFARPDEAHERLDIFDPELIHDWIENKWHEHATGKNPSPKMKIEKDKNAFGLVVDATDRTPKGRLFVK